MSESFRVFPIPLGQARWRHPKLVSHNDELVCDLQTNVKERVASECQVYGFRVG